MNWAKENLRPASFRGIEFKVAAHDAGSAKAVVVHEFPGRDKPYIEEMGRNARQFSIDAFLVGADYIDRRNALIDAIEEAGAAELVHPWLGTLRVHSLNFALRESSGELRMCRIAINFVEAGAPGAPDSKIDPSSSVDSAGRVMLDAAAESFAGVFADVAKPGVAAEGAATSWERVADKLSTFDLSGVASKAAAWQAKLEDVTDKVLEKLAEPGNFTDAVSDIFRSVYDAVGGRIELARLLLDVSRSELGRQHPLLYGGPDADAGDQALSRFVARNAAVEAARVSVLFDWDTYDDAYETRQAIVDVLEDVAADADDTTYQATQDLIAELVAGLPSPDANLPRLDTLTLMRTEPALVLAYQLYDSTARDAEIVARNHVKNPAFLPSQVALQVLVDVG
jgi:prophage DNA circulation protein